MHRYQILESVLAIFWWYRISIGYSVSIRYHYRYYYDVIYLHFKVRISTVKGTDHYGSTLYFLKEMLFAIVQMNGQESFDKAFSDD